MRNAPRRLPKSLPALAWLGVALLILALLVVLVILALIYPPAAAVIGAALVTVLLAVCTQIAKKF